MDTKGGSRSTPPYLKPQVPLTGRPLFFINGGLHNFTLFFDFLMFAIRKPKSKINEKCFIFELKIILKMILQ